MAEMVTDGARVVPARLGELGYRFRHPEVQGALADVLGG
jgi:NAD dependent epimerase/dehydratase family enzyme